MSAFRNPPPTPRFGKSDFYTERIIDVLDDAHDLLDELCFEDLIIDTGLILQQWTDGINYRKRRMKRYD